MFRCKEGFNDLCACLLTVFYLLGPVTETMLSKWSDYI